MLRCHFRAKVKQIASLSGVLLFAENKGEKVVGTEATCTTMKSSSRFFRKNKNNVAIIIIAVRCIFFKEVTARPLRDKVNKNVAYRVRLK